MVRDVGFLSVGSFAGSHVVIAGFVDPFVHDAKVNWHMDIEAREANENAPATGGCNGNEHRHQLSLLPRPTGAVEVAA